MVIQVVRPDELTESELDAWRNMQLADPALANPFLSPEFTLAVGRQRSTARVAVISDGSGPVGFFPFERHRLGIGKPIGFGACDCQGLVHEPDLMWDPIALLRDCDLAVWEFDHLTAGQASFEPHTVQRTSSPIIDVEGGYPEYVDHISRNRKFMTGMRKKERRLIRRHGELRFVFDADQSVLDSLMRWKSVQYRKRQQRDVFSRPSMVSLVRELCQTGSRSCSGTLSALYAGDRLVACKFGLRSQRILSSWFTAFDLEFAEFSPGILIHLRLAEGAVDRGISHIDLGKGQEPYKDSIKTNEIPLFEGQVDRRTVVSALRRMQRRSVSCARDVAMGNPILRRAALTAVDVVDRIGG